MKKIFHIWSLFALATLLTLGIYYNMSRVRLKESRRCIAEVDRATRAEQTQLKRQILAAETEQRATLAKISAAKSGQPLHLSNEESLKRVEADADAQRQNPARREWMHRLNRRFIAEKNSALYSQLNLPPDKLEQFKQLLIEQQESTRDVSALIAKQGLSRSSSEGMALASRIWQESESSIEQVLGTENYKKYKEHRQSSSAALSLQYLQASLMEHSVPVLTQEQITALSNAIRDVKNQKRNPDYAAIANDLGGTRATEQVVQRVNGKLTPEQLAAFVAYREESYAAEKASEAFIRGEAPLPSPPKPIQ